MRLDNLTRDDIRALQERLGSLGFDPGRYDGVWGPRTAAAYNAYLATRERPVMAVTPPAAKPWWQSRRIIGAAVAVLAGLASAFTGVAVDAAETTELVMQAVSVISAAIAWYGSIKGTQPKMNYFVLDARPGSMITEVAEEIPVIEFESPDGRAVISAHVEDLGSGQWKYSYSVQNVDMARQIDEFRVPLPASANMTDDRFHAVFHHNEPIAYKNGPAITNNPWTMTREGDEIVWSTPNNPIRWGTMYSFGFVTDVAPVEGEANLGMFRVRSGDPEYIGGITLVPEIGADCFGDVTGDNMVNLADLNLVLANFGATTTEGDADGDGEVNLADLNLVLANFGNNC